MITGKKKSGVNTNWQVKMCRYVLIAVCIVVPFYDTYRGYLILVELIRFTAWQSDSRTYKVLQLAIG